MSELQKVENWLEKKLAENADLRLLRNVPDDMKASDHDTALIENSIKITKCRKWLAGVRAVFQLKPNND